MPSSDVPIADLGSQLGALLLVSLLWVGLAALIVGASCWFAVQRRREDGRVTPSRDRFLSWSPEPTARKFLRISFGCLWIIDGVLQAQPKMPGGFISMNVAPGIAAAPGWVGDLVAPFARAWSRHPVAADAAVLYIQVGIGLLILIGGRGALARLALWASIVWSLAIWVLGEAFGGLLSSGASWLAGAPGAVLVYTAAAGLLLAPWEWWTAGRATLVARRVSALWLLAGAVLQAVPSEKLWTAAGAAEHFADGARMSQPSFLARPIAWTATLAGNHPVAFNGVVIALLVGVAAGLWLSGKTSVIAAGLLLCAVTWWLAQDFGVLGGTGTDPNTALPLALLLASSLPTWSIAHRQTEGAVAALSPAGARQLTSWRAGLRGGLATVALSLTVIVPLGLASTLAGPADAAGLAADSGGGVRAIPGRPAVDFTLTDQQGRRVSMGSLRGKLVVLTFLDPVCTSDCPLVANQLAIANRELGALAQQVEFVAIDTNPLFHLVGDVDAFTESHGLGGFTNWHFLCGPQLALQNVLDAYGISVDVPVVGMIQHSEGMYFITAQGRQAAYLDDGAGDQLTKSYAQQVRDEVRTLLR